MAASVLMPSWFSDFQCIGPACENNCCDRNWTISLDKKTYLKCRDVKDPELQAGIKASMKRIRNDQRSDKNYAEIVPVDGKRCIFHREDGLCALQKELGTEYLSSTCVSYPREINMIQKDIYEISAFLSCPEVARKSLFHTEPTAFTLFENRDAELILHNNRRVMTRDCRADAEALCGPHGFALRSVLISLLQNRSCTIPERLTLVGMLLLAADNTENHDVLGQLIQTYEEFASSDLSSTKQNLLCQISAPSETAAMLIEKVILSSYVVRRNDPMLSLFRLPPDFAPAPDQNGTISEDALTEALYRFRKLRTKAIFSPFMEKEPHIMENFLVHQTFIMGLPFSYHQTSNLSLYEHFLILCIEYTLMRFLLCCENPTSTTITHPYIIDCVDEAATRTNHNLLSMLDLLKTSTNSGLVALADLVRLIND